jgi:IS5 family transposase
MIKGRKAQRVLVDKSYASKENHADLRGKLRGDILHKVVRGWPPRPSQKRFSKLISKQRFGVEQCFDTMQRLFGLLRVRHFGVVKTHAQMVMAALSQTLLMAANTITFNR